MEKDELRRTIVAMLSITVTMSVIICLNKLPKPVFEKPYWISIVALLLLYWTIFINWYSKRKRERASHLFADSSYCFSFLTSSGVNGDAWSLTQSLALCIPTKVIGNYDLT